MAYAALFEVPIRGLNPGMRLELVLPLAWEEPIGAAPVAVPYGPSDGSLDALRIEATFWVEATAAVALEANAPPYGDNDATMILPVVAGGLAIPGVVGTTPMVGSRQFALIASDDSDEAGFGSEGRHFDGIDLIDYTLSALIPCDQVVTSFSTTVPAAVARQLGKHSWKDWSVHHIGSTSSGSTRSYASNARQQSGRRWKGKVPCKGLTISQADALIQWVRALRGAPAAFPSYLFGPSFAGKETLVVVRSLTLEHQGGHLWDAEFEAYLTAYSAEIIDDNNNDLVDDQGNTLTGGGSA